MQELADKYAAVKEKLTTVAVKFTNEQAVNSALRQIVAELDLELMQADRNLSSPGTSPGFPPRVDGQRRDRDCSTSTEDTHVQR
ncbi:hypothetical protein [Streptomyces sp. NBC_01443]|uniref:hypothetical protein n=1 Tax=Streptomyces sp. NBC_01443 TaxID=2903868 RepID=UPI002254D36E|nr:hypothetical protein [Streptomyces sp. NBC_01443]MCX4632243.1 hypothetical protein [Streptomyces sp. NBC_01443]